MTPTDRRDAINRRLAGSPAGTASIVRKAMDALAREKRMERMRTNASERFQTTVAVYRNGRMVRVPAREIRRAVVEG